VNLENLYNESNEATYCPEDNKLRLYVGRVPRDEYLALRKQGWTSTPKQDCDFVATWHEYREDTALAYAGFIGDEDQTPTDRVADRAERFSMYRDKRRSEAHGLADNYDGEPSVHGFQSQDKAERSAKRHDRIADRACTQWSKAEYWVSRTAGVISSALYKSTPGVRAGRIKKLESRLRKVEKESKNTVSVKKGEYIYYDKLVNAVKFQLPPYWQYTAENSGIKPDETGKFTVDQFKLITAVSLCNDWDIKKSLINGELDPVEYAENWLKENPEPKDWEPGRRYKHLELRLSYEKQMLEAVGGMASSLEMKIGGTYGNYIIWKVNKSPLTKEIISIGVLIDKVQGWQYKTSSLSGTPHSISQHDMVRSSKDGYKEPTPENLEYIKKLKKMIKDSKPKKPSLINPTMESALKIQAVFNEKLKKSSYALDCEKEYLEPLEMTQAGYSVRSKGDYAPTGTASLDESGEIIRYHWSDKKPKDTFCKIRYFKGGISSPNRVIVLTDKPQKEIALAQKQEV